MSPSSQVLEPSVRYASLQGYTAACQECTKQARVKTENEADDVRWLAPSLKEERNIGYLESDQEERLSALSLLPFLKGMDPALLKDSYEPSWESS